MRNFSRVGLNKKVGKLSLALCIAELGVQNAKPVRFSEPRR